MKTDQPHFADKFIAVTGDVCLPELGICHTEREILEREIHVVFHSAATIRFDEPLRYLVLTLSIFIFTSILKQIELSPSMIVFLCVIYQTSIRANCVSVDCEKHEVPSPQSLDSNPGPLD